MRIRRAQPYSPKRTPLRRWPIWRSVEGVKSRLAAALSPFCAREVVLSLAQVSTTLSFAVLQLPGWVKMPRGAPVLNREDTKKTMARSAFSPGNEILRQSQPIGDDSPPTVRSLATKYRAVYAGEAKVWDPGTPSREVIGVDGG